MVAENAAIKVFFSLFNAMLFSFLLSLLMVNACFALYEDQVGLFDWRQKYIGNPKELFFEQTSHGTNKRVFISTESNVLAALNARTGQIVWRRIFEKVDGAINSVLHRSDLLITVSGNGKTVRSWEQSKGDLIWESSNDFSYGPNDEKYQNLDNLLKDHQAMLLDEENGGLLLITNKAVKMISQTDGSDIWLHKIEDDSVFVVGLAKVELKVVVICVKIKSTQVFVNFKYLDIENGKLLSEILIPAPWILHQGVSCALVSSKFLVCLSPKDFVMLVKDYASGSKEAFISTNLTHLNVENLIDSSIRTLSGASSNELFHFKVNMNYNLLLNVHPGESRVDIVKEMHKPGFYTLGKLLNKQYIFEISQDKSPKNQLNIHLYLIDTVQSNRPTLQTSVLYDDRYFQGSPIHCTVFVYSKKNDVSYRVLLATEEHAISLIQNVGHNEGKILWTRNEALSSITFAKMIDLPPSTSASKLELLHAEFANVGNSGILTMFINRVKSQIRQLQSFMNSLRKRRYVDVKTDQQDDNNIAADLKRDQFNIIKVILAMTEGRKLFAINSQNGNIVWTKFLPDIQKYVSSSKVNLIEQRTSAHFPLPPKCVFVAPYNKNLVMIESQNPTATKQKNTAIYSFNPLTGEGLEKPERVESYKILQVAELPFEDEQDSKVVGIVDTEHYFHMYPENKNTLSKLNQHIDSIYIYLVNKTTNSFRGYKVRAVSSSVFQLYKVYSVNIPKEQSIIKVISKRPDEVVNSVGRVLGDHTVLYKYLNPNVVAFLTMQSGGSKGSLFVYIVDVVTGHVLYQARHKGAETPADIILSEHWLIYMYYNSKGRRMEVSVVEFYEGYEEKNHTAFSSLEPVETPMMLSQGYLLPVSSIRAITATCTQHGITAKNILIGLDNGYVYSLPKTFLDPRRNFQQTPMLQEEGVPPYMPEIPFVPQAFMNYNQTVQRIRGMHTSAAGLESTSLVLVYGLDVYFTRVTPSKMFDVLKEDFDYILISGVLSALILTSIAVSKLASMKALKLAWSN